MTQTQLKRSQQMSGIEMNIIVKNIKWIMLFAGLVTCTTVAAVFAPQETLLSMFGTKKHC